MEELNIFNLNNKIQITVEISRATIERGTDSEENSNVKSKEKTKLREPTVKMEGPTYSSRGRNRPRIS
jgi:hypothetical protein